MRHESEMLVTVLRTIEIVKPSGGKMIYYSGLAKVDADLAAEWIANGSAEPYPKPEAVAPEAAPVLPAFEE